MEALRGYVVLHAIVTCAKCPTEMALGTATVGHTAGSAEISQRLKERGWGRNASGWHCATCWQRRKGARRDA